MSQDETMQARIEEQTGRPMAAWIEVLAKAGLDKHGQMVALLKEQGVTHGYANTIVHTFRSATAPQQSEADLIDAQYAGKDGLRPIYDRIVEAATGFGNDVEIAPKKTYVSLRRTKQFALVQPSTKTRVDLGLKLPDTPSGERLEASGSFNQMVSHRVRLGETGDVDDELLGWLRAAYEHA